MRPILSKRFTRPKAQLILRDISKQTSTLAVSNLTDPEVFDDVMICQAKAKRMFDMHAMEAVLYKYTKVKPGFVPQSSVSSSSLTRAAPSL